MNTVAIYVPERDYWETHLVASSGSLTKCLKPLPEMQPGEGDIVVKQVCVHCRSIAPRLGDGFTMPLGVPTAQFPLDYLEAMWPRKDDINTRDQAVLLGLDDRSFDTALPMSWYDDVHRLTGVWPQAYGFVWSYEVAKSGGEPIPLTPAAYMVLGWYRARTETALAVAANAFALGERSGRSGY